MRKRIYLILLFLCLNWLQDVEGNNYIRDWLILGPFKTRIGENSLSFPYLENEAEIYGRGGEKIMDHQWIYYHAPDNVLDFSEPTLKFPSLEQSVAYTQIFIYSPNSQNIQCYLGSDDEIAVWCNQDRIHFNWIQRKHQFDNDTINFRVNRGWNRLLFKVVNVALSWQMSARISAPTAIHIQAQNPFPVSKKLISDSKLRIWKLNPELQSLLNARNLSELHFSFILFNDSPFDEENIAVKLVYSGNHIFDLPKINKISGGELINYQSRIRYNLLDSLIFSTTPPQVYLITSKQEFQELLPIFTIHEALRTFFSPWQIEGWQYQHETNRNIFRKHLVLPDLLKGFEVKFSSDFGQYIGDCSINGKSFRTDCQGFTGYYSLRKAGTNNADFLLELIFENLSSNGNSFKNLPFNSWILPIFPGIEKYLFENRFAAEIFNHKIILTREFELQLYQAFRDYNLRLLSEKLDELTRRQSFLIESADSLVLRMIGISRMEVMKPEPIIQPDDIWQQNFRNIIKNLEEYPQFVFSCGNAYAYWLIEQNAPELFSQIQKLLKKGQWEVLGGTWVEPDLALISGESLIRQFLYGKNYFKDKFNLDIEIGWMPDAVNHPITLPQILQKTGIKIFPIFNPEAVNSYSLWKGPDGSQVLSHILSTRNILHKVDESVGKEIQPVSHKSKAIESVRFFGVSPDGKSDFRRDIETILQLDRLNIYPQMKMGRLDDYYQTNLSLSVDSLDKLPTLPLVNREIQVDHQGSWTSHAKMKWYNRRTEAFLTLTEIFAWLASHFQYTYPEPQLHECWQRMLANQEHELLAGMAPAKVYLSAQQSYQKISETTNQILREALGTLAANINTQFSERDALPLVIFNSLNWKRSAPLEIAILPEQGMNQIELFDSDGLAVPIKITEQQGGLIRFIFLAKDIPEMGYRTYWVVQSHGVEAKPVVRNQRFNFENDFLRISIDAQKGTIKEFFDKKLNQNLITGGGAEFQIQTDRPGTLPIQNLGLQGPVTILDKPLYIDVIEDNLIRKIVRVEYRYQQSNLIQKYIFYKDLSGLEVQVVVNWQEHNKMVKIAFPLHILNPTASFDIPFGIISRPRNGQEVLAHKWCDLSNNDFGLTISNDCKYGFDVKGNTIRMSVLRSPVLSDSTLDLGYHSFSYLLHSHPGDYKKGGSIQQGQNFNIPLVYCFTNMHNGSYPPASSFMIVDPDHIILSALKRSQKGGHTIFRVYESNGEKTDVKVTFPRPAHQVSLTDLLEWSTEKLAQRGYEINFQINPYEIKTFQIKFN